MAVLVFVQGTDNARKGAVDILSNVHFLALHLVEEVNCITDPIFHQPYVCERILLIFGLFSNPWLRPISPILP